MTPLAALADVDVEFRRGARALDGVTLAIARHDVVGIVGESGSGKTTLCRALLGLLPVARGRVTFDGAALPGDMRSLRRRAQMLLQDAVASLSPRMRVGAAMEEPLRIHGLDLDAGRARLAALLRRLGLPDDIGRRYPHQVSGGQARRIGVARALVMQPELLVADEPTAGLDVSVQGELLNLLRELHAEFGLTLVIVSHNLHVVRRVTRRTAVMYLGQVMEDAPTRSLFDQPAHPYAAALLSASPTLRDAAGPPIVLRGEIPSLLAPPAGCRFHTRCPVAQPNCARDAPVLRAIGDGHFVRCHYPFALQRGPAPTRGDDDG